MFHHNMKGESSTVYNFPLNLFQQVEIFTVHQSSSHLPRLQKISTDEFVCALLNRNLSGHSREHRIRIASTI